MLMKAVGLALCVELSANLSNFFLFFLKKTINFINLEAGWCGVAQVHNSQCARQERTFKLSNSKLLLSCI